MASSIGSAPAAGLDDTELMTGEAVALDLRPTSFVLSAAGAMIDFVLSIGVLLLLMLALSSPLIANAMDQASAAAVSVVVVVFCVVVLPTGVELATQGRSLGRLAIGARIVRDDGGSIGFRHAFIRALTGVLEFYLSLGGVAAMTALLNGRSKRLGDLLAGTYSQNERVPRLARPATVIPPALAEWALTADVARMPDPLSRRVSQYLAQAGRLTLESRDRLGTELLAEVSRYVSPVPFAHPLDVLAAVAVVRRDREFRALELERERLERLEPALRTLPHRFPDRG